jgi:hypothetical protein
VEDIQKKVATGDTQRKSLPEPVPVFLLYHTALASPGRDVEIRPDFYGRDEALWLRLQKRPPDQGAQRIGQLAAPQRSLPVTEAVRRPLPASSARPAAPRRS